MPHSPFATFALGILTKDMELLGVYRYFMEDKADPRVADWPLMGSPLPLAVIISAYLAFVLRFGPHCMKNRKPYTLNKVMIYYNITISIANGVLFYGILTSGWTTNISWGCEPFTLSYDPESLNMVRWMWWTLIVKISELGDTVIFILRKKRDQTSFLHIYHHATSVPLTWIVTKFVPGGMWTFVLMINSLVHVVMYFYYLLTCLGPWMQNKLAPWKAYITTLQMVQFVIIILHTCQAFLPSCEPNRRPLAFTYLFQTLFIFYLFWGYYKQAYLEKRKNQD
ncbi:hypothetical protein KM043_002112 [Ampulex compressa]|nr:hypothetical protein KM043_002112 [Ampulex compressa]